MGPGNAYEKQPEKLNRAQRRVAKIILATREFHAETRPKWVPQPVRRDVHCMNLMFKCSRGMPSAFFQDYFKV